jgi:CheY-like chemotaxis protein
LSPGTRSFQDIDVTGELVLRPKRPPGHAAENAALVELARHMTEAPHLLRIWSNCMAGRSPQPAVAKERAANSRFACPRPADWTRLLPVLLDIGLPGMNGDEVAKRLCEEECGKDALIVAVSGYGQEEDRQRTKAAGFDYHLVKGISYDELQTLLRPKS